MDWDEDRCQKMATAALYVYSTGNHYGKYMAEREESFDPAHPEEGYGYTFMTEAEFDAGAKYDEYVFEAVARLIANHESGYYPS